MAEKKTEKEIYDKMLDFDDIDNMIEIEDVNDDKVEEVEVIQKGKNHTLIRRGKTGGSGRVAGQVGLIEGAGQSGHGSKWVFLNGSIGL